MEKVGLAKGPSALEKQTEDANGASGSFPPELGSEKQGRGPGDWQEHGFPLFFLFRSPIWGAV